MLLLAAIVWRSWRIGLNRRHRAPFVFYASALAAVFTGGTAGALIGTGAVGGSTWLALRQAHIALNVLGFASLTIAGTLITLLPTVLRVRMPATRTTTIATAMIAGAGILAAGLGVQNLGLAAAGAVLFAAAATATAWTAVAVARLPRRHFAGISAKHFLAALAWFVAGSITLAVALLRAAAHGEPGPIHAFQTFEPVFLLAFVGGWVLQTLLGAWLFLLPAGRLGDPEERRLMLTGTELGGTVELGLLNAGLCLLALHAEGVRIPLALECGQRSREASGHWRRPGCTCRSLGCR
jgi:nitrite reductase (NO-forming)